MMKFDENNICSEILSLDEDAEGFDDLYILDDLTQGQTFADQLDLIVQKVPAHHWLFFECQLLFCAWGRPNGFEFIDEFLAHFDKDNEWRENHRIRGYDVSLEKVAAALGCSIENAVNVKTGSIELALNLARAAFKLGRTYPGVLSDILLSLASAHQLDAFEPAQEYLVDLKARDDFTHIRDLILSYEGTWGENRISKYW